MLCFAKMLNHHCHRNESADECYGLNNFCNIRVVVDLTVTLEKINRKWQLIESNLYCRFLLSTSCKPIVIPVHLQGRLLLKSDHSKDHCYICSAPKFGCALKSLKLVDSANTSNSIYILAIQAHALFINQRVQNRNSLIK